MHIFSNEAAPMAFGTQDDKQNYRPNPEAQGSDRDRSNAASKPGQRTGIETHDTSRIAYLITHDEQLGGDLSAAIEHRRIRAKWFKSASEFLAFNHPKAASCLLISRQLSDMSGLDLQRMLAPTSPPPIIFLSDRRDIPSCVRAIKEGAVDFLTLPLITPHLLEAVEAAFEKDGAALLKRQQSEDLRNRWRSLTSREAEVMRYAVGGFLNKQTAAELRIAENTVQVHRARVMRKMGADSFAALVRMSVQLVECGERILLQAAAKQACEFSPVFHKDGMAIRPSTSLNFHQNGLSVGRNAYA